MGAGACRPAQAVLTVGAVDTGVLVVTEEKAAVALTLVAAHGIDTDLLAPTIVVLTLIHVCEKRKSGERRNHTWGGKQGHGQFPRQHERLPGVPHRHTLQQGSMGHSTETDGDNACCAS